MHRHVSGLPAGSRVRLVPWIWKAGMLVLIVCLVASMAIAIVRLATTPTEILGDDFHGLPQRPAVDRGR
jgi:hypothetical protein